jgi:predicted ribosome quality control (RQC) complex YloA/Tae2 family protein
MIETRMDEFTILVGSNSKENDTLVRESNPEDYWIHISDFPSAHAIVKVQSAGKFPLKPIKQACVMIKQRSNKCKSMRKLKFDITRIKNIEPTDVLGQVIVQKVLRNISI